MEIDCPQPRSRVRMNVALNTRGPRSEVQTPDDCRRCPRHDLPDGGSTPPISQTRPLHHSPKSIAVALVPRNHGVLLARNRTERYELGSAVGP